MIGKIYITGEIGVDTTLLDVIKQVKAQASSTEFLVKIDSIGGYVDDGMAIYNYLKNLVQPVTTITSKAYSIASVIFMAGSTRIIPQDTPEALMIHLPWTKVEGNHQVITEYLKELKVAEDEMVDFYSKAIEIDKNTIHSLLSQESFLSDKQALELGFATEIAVPQQAVARLNNTKEIEENFMNKISRKLDSILMKLSGTKIKAELVLQDVTGVEITFPDLSSTDTPAIDDKALVDGKPADGEFTLPDNTVLTLLKGVVTEVETAEVEKEEDAMETPQNAAPDATTEAPAETTVEPDADDALIAELQTKVQELQAIIDELMSAEQTEMLLNALETQATKHSELETKFQALAKQVGSDFSAEKKEIKTSIRGNVEGLTKAQRMLNNYYENK